MPPTIPTAASASVIARMNTRAGDCGKPCTDDLPHPEPVTAVEAIECIAPITELGPVGAGFDDQVEWWTEREDR